MAGGKVLNGRAESLPPLDAVSKGLSTAGPGTLKRSATSVSAKQLKRASTINLPSGRLYKFLGDLCLLAGRLSEAQDW